MDKGRCTALSLKEMEDENMQPRLGTAYVNIKNISNGFYTLYLVRISKPLTINSYLTILTRIDEVLVNIDRELLNKTYNSIKKDNFKVTQDMLQEKMSIISEEKQSNFSEGQTEFIKSNRSSRHVLPAEN